MWSSSPSSSAPPYAPIAAAAAAGKTMDEVWREISTLTPHLHPSSASSRGVILQDFLSGDPSPPPASPTPPPTVLTLNSSAHHLSSMVLRQPPPQQHPHVPCSSSLKKRLPAEDVEMNPGGGGGGGERRHKRMIKNRESAARSRARKQQAYTNELELEVAHLLEENAKLKEKHRQLCRAVDAHQHPKRKPHHRTFSAPF